MLSKKPRILQYISVRIRTGEPEHISQVRQILTEYVKKGTIISFEKLAAGERLDSKTLFSPVFRICYMSERHFDFVLRRPYSFTPMNGIEVAQQCEQEVVAFVSDTCALPEIQRELFLQIKGRLKGFRAEDAFTETGLELVRTDSEVSALIHWISASTMHQNKFLGIDRIIILKNSSFVPLQIKCGPDEQKEHRKNYPEVPSLLWKGSLRLQPYRLKDLLLEICMSYQKGVIKHL